MSVQKHPTQTHGRTRRQNHSCDQCRKSKRACDATTGQRSPCSYCARTKKRCTTEWARSRAQSGFKPSRQQPHLDILTREILPWMADQPQLQGDISTLDGLLDFNPSEDLLGWGSNPAAAAPLDYNLLSLDPASFNNPHPAQEEPEQSALTTAHCVPNMQLDLQLPDLGLDPTPSHQSWQTPLTYNTLQYASSSSSDISWMPWTQKSPAAQTSPRTQSLSPFSIDQQMISAANSHLTSANLLQIYHDVLEHNLSCWVTEQTCPYKRGWQGNGPQAVPEWGSFWSNRIYQRTIKLDRVAQSCKLVSMTKTEERSASKALHLSIMAFATQWAQGSQRHREKYSNTFLDHSSSSGSTTEFDRVLQNHFWDQARRALQDVADVESYQVACAELIFALTQRPWESEEENTSAETEQRSESTTALLRVRDILQKDGPPVHIERAARKMHALKYRCDAVETGLRRQADSKEAIACMDPEDRASISLLYWLAIMFDTVSASMNERPVVIQDEECQHEAETPSPPSQSETKKIQNQIQPRWDMDLFVPGGLDKTTQTHWPCTYSVAAEDITKSAPAKVLLFRHVSYLQNAVRKLAHPTIIEDIIRSTMSLYKHWNKTHGAFFTEMVHDYNTVPQRIQGWFVCISAHWHLGTLMFADLLDFIHENSLGAQDKTASRVEDKIASQIRKHSSGELADLARVATPATLDATLGVPQMPGFHHAVNEGTLLTEPWTMIPIRAFTKAGLIFLDAAEELARLPEVFVQDGDGHGFARNVEQAEDCIKGLWLLGKKSDMARKIAETLSGALARLRDGFDI
ncbi:hypothetical protein ASPVEDRAFT_64728 [Aspergillus versicolor CBS 583.65]|uniref:Zn(2)-C6 fungal-type domain-containing protein n=1 Tax=Aspergillus versicolor CBS 583.65 TaxID=1036611 RepID=A0A1L9PW47_ASPVE|nr:uncharacterized protein ASPVEDRAFT_64728 [Aspergillus versicolor CBS 583.65]OJJ05770.1 hypothetical protein ASPVEDRAFT_64728 [Aspergillus versicolor CBS 583.65]